jgi:hypothetical protein
MGKNLRLSENNLHLQVRLPRSQTGDISSVYVQDFFGGFSTANIALPKRKEI